ncbi:MAG: hypothetical protein QXK12_08460 [Candidatus Nezhaarchaeales archaeon]
MGIVKLFRKALREELKLITLFIDNGLNQDVTIQVKGNREKALAKSVNIGSPITVAKNSTDARTLSPDTSGYLPYITLSLVCGVAPTSGSITIYRIRSSADEVKVVDTLEIRDTSAHDNSTDPTKIFVVDW